MNYGICHLSVVPCRAKPSDKSEMVTQLLFGETFVIEEQNEKWISIKTHYDNYTCWIDKKQYLPISSKLFSKINKETIFLSNTPIHVIEDISNKTAFPIPLGSTLPLLNKTTIDLEKVKYTFDGEAIAPFKTKAKRNTIIENAFLYLNSPYLWGGRTQYGIDCSGFTQIVYKLSGIKILRDASQQAKQGKALSFIEESQVGDLAFFDNEAGNITHVGILLGNNKIIHASGKVRVDDLDHQGIYNNELKKYTHQLRIIKHYI